MNSYRDLIIVRCNDNTKVASMTAEEASLVSQETEEDLQLAASVDS